MAKVLQLRRGTTSENNAFTGAVGELTVDTDKHELRLHDGTTQGGHPIIDKRLSHDNLRENLITAPDSYQREAQNHPYVPPRGDGYSDNSYNSVYAIGSSIPDTSRRAVYNTAVGALIGSDIVRWNYNTVVGCTSMAYSPFADRNTVLGSESAIWAGAMSVEWLKRYNHGFWRDGVTPDKPGWDVDGLETLFAGVRNQIANFNGYATDETGWQYNVCIGRDAACQTVAGQSNTLVGYRAGAYMYAGSSNTFIGTSAGSKAVFSDACVSIGRLAGDKQNGAYGTISIGNSAGENATGFTRSIFIGHEAAKEYKFKDGYTNGAVWIGHGSEAPTIGGYGVSASVNVPPDQIRDRLHVRYSKSDSSLSPDARGILIESASSSGITLESNAASYGAIQFADKDSAYAGYINYNHSNNGMSFATNGAVRTRISSSGEFYPNASGSQSLGISSRKWSQLFASTATIETSDEREKANIIAPDDALMRAWGKVGFRVFQFKDSITEKGEDKARLHVGVIAQEVQAAFASEGLDANRYGLFCYDSWGDQYESVAVVDAEAVYDEDGNLVTPEQFHIEQRKIADAGDAYGIRYEEALALECAYQRWRLNQIEARLS